MPPGSRPACRSCSPPPPHVVALWPGFPAARCNTVPPCTPTIYRHSREKSTRASESDGATAQAVSDLRSLRCFNTYRRGVAATDFRRSRNGAETARGRTQSTRRWRAMARARARDVCGLRRVSLITPQHAPDACTHRMQLSSLYLDEDADGAGLFSKDCFEGQFRSLPVNVEHMSHPVHARTRSCTSTSRNESPIFASRDEETLWRGGSKHGTTDERKRHLTAILRGRAGGLGTRAGGCACCNGPGLWQPIEPRFRAFESGCACGRSVAGDSGRNSMGVARDTTASSHFVSIGSQDKRKLSCSPRARDSGLLCIRGGDHPACPSYSPNDLVTVATCEHLRKL